MRHGENSLTKNAPPFARTFEEDCAGATFLQPGRQATPHGERLKGLSCGLPVLEFAVTRGPTLLSLVRVAKAAVSVRTRLRWREGNRQAHSLLSASTRPEQHRCKWQDQTVAMRERARFRQLSAVGLLELMSKPGTHIEAPSSIPTHRTSEARLKLALPSHPQSCKDSLCSHATFAMTSFANASV